MLVRKHHFCTELSGRLFKCNKCNRLPKVIREIRCTDDDTLLNVEIIIQRNNNCYISYDMGVNQPLNEDAYEIVICGNCSSPVHTIFTYIGIT